MTFSDDELVKRMKLIVREIKCFPTDSKKVNLDENPSMNDVPYWARLLEQIKSVYGSLQNFYDRRMDRNILRRGEVDFPNEAQEETTTQMIERPKLLVRDRAGAGKTAPLIKAKFALEQLVYNGPVNTVVICPNFVLSSWQSKLKEYLIDRARVLTLTSSSRHRGIREFERAIKSGELDFTLVSYDALFRFVNGNGRDEFEEEEKDSERYSERAIRENMDLADSLIEILEESEKPFVLGIDECHNAKNPGAFRSRAVRKLALAADRLYALSGNVFKNDLEDIGEIASLLDNVNFPDAKSFNQACEGNPRLIRLFLKRFGKEPVIGLNGIPGVPRAIIHEPIEFEMSEDEQRLYYSLPEFRELSPGSKLVLLRLAALDGRLLDRTKYKQGKLKEQLKQFFDANPELLRLARNIKPTLYEHLDRLAGEIAGRGEKIVIWSKFREGIMQELERRYSKYGFCRIDGTVDSDSHRKRYSDRDIARLTFQTDPDKRVLAATIDSLREGQDLHAANNMVTILLDVSPGSTDQTIGRLVRIGQRKEVNVYTIHAAGSINQAVYQLEQSKRRAIEDVDKGRPLDKKQKEALSRKTPVVAKDGIRQQLMNAHSRVRIMSGHLVNKGAEAVQEYLGLGMNARIYAQSYNYMWNFSYSAHTARLISQLVAEIEEKSGRKLEDIVDLGSGPATVSRILRRPSLCVDLNAFQLEAGKRECESLGVNIETRVGNIEDLTSVEDLRYDLAVCSLALHYSNCENGGRKRVILEANRILKSDGYFILMLPKNIVEGDGRQKLEEGLLSLGLEPLPNRSGFAKAIDSVKKEYEVYAVVCRKVHGNPDSLYTDTRLDENFLLNPEFFYRRFEGSETNGENGCAPQGYNMEVCSAFEFENGDILSPRKARSKATQTEKIEENPRAPNLVSVLDRYLIRRSRREGRK